MDDLDKYIADRKKKDATFAKNFDKGYKTALVAVLNEIKKDKRFMKRK